MEAVGTEYEEMRYTLPAATDPIGDPVPSATDPISDPVPVMSDAVVATQQSAVGQSPSILPSELPPCRING